MKRKILLLTMSLLLIALPVSAVAVYNLSPVTYPVLVNGEKLNSDLPIMTYKYNGGDNTYVPLRAVLDMMGAQTDWDGKKVNIKVGADPAKVADSVVQIYVVKNGQDVSRASGVIIDYDEILTCYHVADSGDSYRIIFNDGHTTTATLKKYAKEVDAAILEPAEKKIKPVKIGDSEEVQEGDKVFVISSPKGNKNVIFSGEIADISKDIYLSTKGDYGSSGGGVFSLKTGELIGIVNAGSIWTGKDIAKPINTLRKSLSN